MPPPGFLRRDRRRVPAAAAVIFLLSLCVLPSSARDLRPSDHGLASQKNATLFTPAMAAFFSGAGAAAPALPPVRNTTVGIWPVAGKAAPVDGGATPMVVLDGRDRVRTVLLTAGVVCATVGVALFAGVATAFVVHSRRRDGGAAAD